MSKALQSELRRLDRVMKATPPIVSKYNRLKASILEKPEGEGVIAIDKATAAQLLDCYKELISALEKQEQMCVDCVRTISAETNKDFGIPPLPPGTTAAPPPPPAQPPLAISAPATATKKHTAAHTNSTKKKQSTALDNSTESTLDQPPPRPQSVEQKLGNIPIWKGKGTPPSLCGAVQVPDDYIVPHGFLVAARVSPPREAPVQWILATVLRYLAGKRKYEIEDADPGDENDPAPYRSKFTLPRNAVIPLANSEPERFTKETVYPKNSVVLAMFPNTTTFYRATVLETPINRKTRDYLLHFDDDEENGVVVEARAVKPRYVCKWPDDAP